MKGEQPLRTTRFSDVCGSLDELKRLLREETTPDFEMLTGLLDDIRYMLGRMEGRLQEYTEFEREAERALKQIRDVEHSRRKEALTIADQMNRALEEGQVNAVSLHSTKQGFPRSQAPLRNARAAESLRRANVPEVEAVCQQAEQIRDVANEMEQKLRRAKQASIFLYQLYLRLRGQRDWSREEAANIVVTTDEVKNLTALPDAWLPPSPHREHILDFLTRGRAHLLPSPGENQIPYVEFEDGGVMLLSDVRWSESVRNFYPAGQEPHPGGGQHRGR